MKTLTEFIAKKHQTLSNHIKYYKYRPETKEELIENIKDVLKTGNCNLNCIDTSKITDMAALFNLEDSMEIVIELTEEQQKKLDVSEWNVSKVKTTNLMFADCKGFNCDLSKWNVSSVENTSGMFDGCENFNSDLFRWDVSNVGEMQYMFYGCKKFNSDLSSWDVSNVTDMIRMFADCSSFNSDLSKWDVSNVEELDEMFRGCTSLKNKPSWYKG